MTEPAPKAPARTWLRLLALVGVVLLILALALYATRRTLARDVLTAWLRSKGVTASAEVQQVGLADVTGALRIGDPNHPDFTVDQVRLGYGLKGLGLQVSAVTLVHPVLSARLHEGRLSAGALDPLIESLRKGPARPNAALPRIEIQGGVLHLATDYGQVEAAADGLVEGGKLVRLAARTGPTRLQARGVSVALGPGALDVQTRGSRIELSLSAPAAAASAAGFSAENARLRLTAAGPYPDLAHRREDGAVVAHAELAGGRIAVGGQAVRDALVSTAFTGQAAGGVDDFALRGGAVADLRAGAAEAGGGKAGPLRAAASAEDLSWTRKGGDSVRLNLTASGSLDSYVQGALKLTQVTAAAQGLVAVGPGGMETRLATHALGRGAWTGLGAPTREDSADMAAVKRAARGFRFAAPAVTLARAGGKLRVDLGAPVRLLPDGGGAVSLAKAGSDWRLAVSGGGLPTLQADAARVAVTPQGLAADGRIKAALSIGPIQKGVFDAAGTLRLGAGGVSFAGDRCAEVAAARLVLGANDVTRLSGRFCPAGRPLLELKGGGWGIAGRVDGGAGEVPFLQARFAKAAGALDFGGMGSALQARMSLTGAQVLDAAPATRFNPVGVSGALQLSGGVWRGSLGVKDGAGRPLAQVALRHDGASGRGGLEVATGTLRFAQGGLQPADLSPLAATLGSPADGEVAFKGRFDWTPASATSSGALDVPRLEFQSPAGRVAGVSGRIVFTSLAPLIAAPGQTLQAEQVVTPLGLVTSLRVTFGLAPGALDVTGGEAALGGGKVRIESLELPLGGTEPTRGVLDLDGVQLHDLVEASPFGDRVDLDAKVSGRIPFELQGGKVRIRSGDLHAIAPGQLSIQRAALANVAASGEVTAPGAPAAAAPAATTDTFTDFAYQAMENLAFSTLEAKVDSQPGGRLGVLFHIVGRHDPPQHQEIRLSIFDLIGRKFLGKQLPLPSGTGVDLTLDTTLNLDDLLADYGEFRRLQGSAPVQP